MIGGAFLVTENRVINGPNDRSLHSFTHTAHSLINAIFSMLALLARSVHKLAHSLCSLPCGTVEILEYVHTVNTFEGNY